MSDPMLSDTLTSKLRAQREAGREQRPGTLLLVDDEQKVCRGLRRILRNDGYRIHVANNAEQAMEILATHPVDVIVSDQRMPGKKGTDFLREVQASYPATVRMILSGASEIQDVASAMGSGIIYKYLTKPIDPALLRANVGEAFSRALALGDTAGRVGELDTTTGLPTRHGLEAIYRELLGRGRSDGNTVCLLMLAVDQHDSVVSSFGRSFARRFVNEVALRIDRALEGNEVLGHDAPGTFILLTSASDPVSRIMLIDHDLGELLARPVHIDGRTLTVTLSIGATALEADLGFDDLVDQAHAAMMTGKDRGGATIELYQPRLVAELRAQLELESDLRQAVTDRCFHVYYQPQVDVTSGSIVGLEALLRWPHPQHGFVSPAQFIPLAEKLGLIHELGAWVLDTAVEQFATWQRGGLAPHEIAVNVSARQIRDAALVERVRAVLEKFELAPSRLVLEITESAAIEQSDAISACLDELRKLGVTLAVDDFGTGYANLGNLTRFAFKKLKIDRSLLPQNHRDERATRLYTNVVGMAAELGLATIAEGVESPGELAAVYRSGCTVVQGFFYSAPLSTERVSKLLADRFPVFRAGL